MRICNRCLKQIPPARLEAVPNAVRCVNCSTTSKHFGLMDYSHKTAPSIVIVAGDDKESIRRMKNVFHRKR